ncbi:hypothetical protein GGR54DRAFT_103352 [Hypoxylon sp. NC1633]|nr:hypothetical protein GGR54DRAFT_103352 [Hypoxylon sp. NC1633]
MQCCYCANYYAQVNCQNVVTQFGERCKLCTALNEGTPLKHEKHEIFSVPSRCDVYDSEAVEDDSSSSSTSSREESQRGRTRSRSDHSSTSSK